MRRLYIGCVVSVYGKGLIEKRSFKSGENALLCFNMRHHQSRV